MPSSDPLGESALYAPIKAFLEAQDYEVKGEVEGCDVVATRGDESPVVVELKQRFNLELVLQGIERQRVSDLVYPGASPPLCSSPDALESQATRHPQALPPPRIGPCSLYIVLPVAECGSSRCSIPAPTVRARTCGGGGAC